jgi:hypothetical protein
VCIPTSLAPRRSGQAFGFNKVITAFTVNLAPHLYDPTRSLPAHESVLRPLVKAASGCWVYEIVPESWIWSVSSEILRPHRGEHRIRTDLEMIRGYELFWNAIGGERGTIVILVDGSTLLSLGVFQHCSRPSITGNMGAAHTPSALRWAKQCVRGAGMAALLLSRNNGMEVMDVLAEPELCLRLFKHAYAHNNGKNWNELASLTEPGATPNCGPTTPVASSEITEGPQSVT